MIHRRIYAVQESHAMRGFLVDEAFIAGVSAKAGCNLSEWKEITPEHLASCVISEFLERYEVKGQ